MQHWGSNLIKFGSSMPKSDELTSSDIMKDVYLNFEG